MDITGVWVSTWVCGISEPVTVILSVGRLVLGHCRGGGHQSGNQGDGERVATCGIADVFHVVPMESKNKNGTAHAPSRGLRSAAQNSAHRT
jgi:hypothetical protein